MRSKILATFVTLAALAATSVTGVAFAAEGQKGAASGGKASFPMPAPAFKQKVDARISKARSRMEKHAAKMSAEDAKQLRAKFEAGVAQVNQEVAKATADGTVTKDEAQRVREVSRSVTAHHGTHARKHPKKK
jgi:hypothetical protein